MYLGSLQVPFDFETPELEEVVGNVFLVFILSHPLLEPGGAFVLRRRQPQLLDHLLKRCRNGRCGMYVRFAPIRVAALLCHISPSGPGTRPASDFRPGVDHQVLRQSGSDPTTPAGHRIYSAEESDPAITTVRNGRSDVARKEAMADRTLAPHLVRIKTFSRIPGPGNWRGTFRCPVEPGLAL